MSIYDDLIPKGGTAAPARPSSAGKNIYADLIPAPPPAPTEKPGVIQSVKNFFLGGAPAEPKPATTPYRDLSGSIYGDLIPKPETPAPAPRSWLNTALKKTSDAIASAAAPPPPETQGVAAYLPSEIVRHLPFGVGEIIKQIQDDPETAAHLAFGDIAKSAPGAILDYGKEVVKSLAAGGLNLAGLGGQAATAGKWNGKVRFDVPGLGEISNNQFRAAARIADGEDPYVVTLEEGANSIFNTLFFVDLAMKPFIGRPIKTAEFKGNLTLPAGGGKPGIVPEGASVPAPIFQGPRSFRLYEPPTQTRPLTPSMVAELERQGINLGKKFDPSLPTYFRVTGGKGSSVTGQVVQVRPSYFQIISEKLFSRDAKIAYWRDTVANSHAINIEKSIAEGDVPREAIYKPGKGKILTENFAEGRINDIAQKLDKFQPGLGDQFRGQVDPGNSTMDSIVVQGENILRSSLPPESVPPPSLTEVVVAGAVATGKVPTQDTTILHQQEVNMKKATEAARKPVITLGSRQPAAGGQPPLIAPREIVSPAEPAPNIFQDLIPREPATFKELQPLADEARKYGSAEEFVNDQAYKIRNRLQKETGARGDKMTTLYHGTDAESARLIQETGKIGRSPDDITFFTKSAKEAKEYAQNKAKYRGGKEPVIIKVEVPAQVVRKGQQSGAGGFEYEVDGILDYKDGIARHSNENLVRTFAGEKPIQSQLTDFYNQATRGRSKQDAETTYQNGEKLVKPPADEKQIALLHDELHAAYQKAEPGRVDQSLGEIYTELTQSEAGKRLAFYGDADGVGSDLRFMRQPSTFPSWIPDHLRSKALFEKVIPTLTSIETLRFPEGNRPKQRQLMNELLNEIDLSAGVDTSAIRDKILEQYGEAKPKPKETDSGEEISVEEIFGGSAPGGARPATTGAGAKPSYQGGGGSANIGSFADGTPVKAGHLDNIKPVEFPELVDIARDLMGEVPKVRQRLGKKLGLFTGKERGEIKLHADLFKGDNLEQAAKTLAHEIGHLVDYLPDHLLKRGNLLGHLFTLKKFMSSTFSTGEDAALNLKEIRTTVFKDTLEQEGVSWGKFMTDPTVRERLKPIIKEKYRAKVGETDAIKNSTIKEELTKVSEYWRPYDKEGSSAGYVAYRAKPSELYADAISMLLNSPGLLQEMAPTFYDEFFGALDRKPEARAAYFEVQGLLTGDRETLILHRREGVQQMFKSGDYKAIELQNERMAEREKRNNNLWFKMKFDLVDKNFALIDRVRALEKKGVHINPDDNPVYYLEERNYLGGKIKAFVETKIQPVYQDLQKAGIPWHVFGESLFYERIIAGDRTKQANPRGISPESAKELERALVGNLTEEQGRLIVDAGHRFRDALRDIAEEAYQEGLYTPELYKQMRENPAYVTFQVIDHLEEGMSSKVYRSIGTLKDITNPADASILKTIATIRAIERNKVTREVVDFLKEHYSAEIEPARAVFMEKNGRRFIESRQPNQEMVIFYRGGKTEGHYVDPYIKKSIDNESVGNTFAVVTGLKFFNSHLFRPLFIGFNLGFQGFNAIRDFKRFYKNIPDMTIGRAVARYAQALPVAKVRAFGAGNAPTTRAREAQNILHELEEGQVFSTTMNDLIGGEAIDETQIERILRTSGIESFKPEVRYPALNPFVKVLEFIKNLGDLIETLPKAAGYYELSDGKPLTKADKSYIRRHVGSPDFLAGGNLKPATNEIFLFSNAITQGIRSDIEISMSPRTRGAYWWKTMKLDLLPKLLMLAAGLGLFGATIKKIMEDASEYDKTNYTIVPLGIDNSGKSIYFRMPSDEGGRLLGGIFWKVINAANNKQPLTTDLAQIASLTGGQLPSVSPLITAGGATADYLAGQNPYDSFRGRNIISEEVFKAGGMRANKQFLGWIFQQLGGGIFYRFGAENQPSPEPGTAEKIFNLPVISNILGRFFRVTDYGTQERLRQVQQNVMQKEAQQRLENKDAIAKYIEQARQDKNIGLNRRKYEDALVKEVLGGPVKSQDDASRAKRLVTAFRAALAKNGADPGLRALLGASSNAQKVEILNDLKDNLPLEEFSKLLETVRKERAASGDVIRQIKK